MAEVQVLLATYNGEKYLPDLLGSLIKQTFKGFELLVSDDGSDDRTLEILRQYSQQLNITIIPSDGKKGSAGNFYYLLGKATADYLLFCDQDDIWLEDKIETSVSELKRRELVYPGSACLCYADMTVVDEKLQVLQPSFLKQHRLDPRWSQDPFKVLSQSMAAGCTMCFNRSLQKKITVYPPRDLFQHDHLLMIYAAWYGKITYLERPLLLYRQHNQNQVGAHGTGIGYFFGKLRSVNTVFRRWSWLRSHLHPAPSISRLAYYKTLLSLMRLFKNND